MDQQLKKIIDAFLPYTDEEIKSTEHYDKKTELRSKLAKAIIAYKNMEPIELPGVEIDMMEVLKRMNKEN